MTVLSAAEQPRLGEDNVQGIDENALNIYLLNTVVLSGAIRRRNTSSYFKQSFQLSRKKTGDMRLSRAKTEPERVVRDTILLLRLDWVA